MRFSSNPIPIIFYAICFFVLPFLKCFAGISNITTVHATTTPEVDNWGTRHEKANREEKKAKSTGETTQDQENQKALSKANPKETFFIKTGGGTFLDQLFFTHYNRPDMGGNPAEVITNYGIGGFIESAAGGLDFLDGFSLFLSAERLPNSGSYLLNAQYTFLKNNPVEVYVYGGGGLGLFGSNLGPGFQSGLGTNIELAKNYQIFIETKAIFAFGNYTSPISSTFSYSWDNLYTPVLTGMKFTL